MNGRVVQGDMDIDDGSMQVDLDVNVANNDVVEENVDEADDTMERSVDDFDDAVDLDISSEDDYNSDNEDDADRPTWLDDPLYENATHTIGDTVVELLQYFFENAETKRSLGKLLDMWSRILPQPNNLPKTRWRLMKILNQIMPSHHDASIRHRFCNSCNTYLGLWSAKPRIIQCTVCRSSSITGMFLEYSIRAQLIDAFEIRGLDKLIDEYDALRNNRDPNYMYDIVDGTEYKKNKERTVTQQYDIILQWNTDGAPIAKSSKAQIWPVQAQILNINPGHRRGFQMVCGLYYSMSEKPCMNTFLKPFSDSMIDLYDDGVEWKQGSTGLKFKSKVIAPVATLDAPAKAAAQNLIQYNGKFGCSYCEISGETYKTENGSVHIYPETGNDAPLRTHESMVTCASKVLDERLENEKGVKGPTVIATLPFFNIASGFVTDYLHIVLKGVELALITLWTQSRYHTEPFYLSKAFQDEINQELSKIMPPDEVTRTPRTLDNLSFWKASELKIFLLIYSPILLRGRLSAQYYQHYLLLVQSIHTLLQSKIHMDQIDLADTLLCVFVIDMQKLYGRRHMTFNIHQLRHLATSVRLWGPLFSSSTFPYEDGNGSLKRIKHGPNKVDIEIFNTIKLWNAYQILKHMQQIIVPRQSGGTIQALGACKLHKLNPDEIAALENANFSNRTVVENNSTFVYYKVKVNKMILTSELYTRQKKRDNHQIVWNNNTLYGVIKFFVSGNDNSLYAIVRGCIENRDPRNVIIHTATEIVLDSIKPIRETYSIHAIPVETIEGKVIRVQNYMCTLPNMWEKK